MDFKRIVRRVIENFLIGIVLLMLVATIVYLIQLIRAEFGLILLITLASIVVGESLRDELGL